MREARRKLEEKIQQLAHGMELKYLWDDSLTILTVYGRRRQLNRAQEHDERLAHSDVLHAKP